MTVKLVQTIPVPGLPRRIELGSRILSVGSCFSEHIAGRLADRRFQVCSNPSGILYNPGSIARLLLRLAAGREYGAADVFEHDGLWRSFAHHGCFSNASQAAALGAMNREFADGVEALRGCDWLIVTFGTAFAWYHESQADVPVANCHRLPTEQFERRVSLSVDIVTEWRAVLDRLIRARPDVNVVLSVSPVRYLRGTATENTLSKAHLHIAVHELARLFPRVHVFPAFEIVLDELRDYRFFSRDLAHPNDLAQDMVWERFRDACLSEQARAFTAAYEPIRLSLAHRPLAPVAGQAQQSVERLLARIDALAGRFPDVGLADVRRRVRERLPQVCGSE